MKKSKKDVLIIIPAFNEEENLGRFLDKLKATEVAAGADILVINDGSKDETEAVAKEKGVHVANHLFRMGYGSALQLGYCFAWENGYRYVIQMDADGQHDVCNLQTIYESLTTPDENGECPHIVLGSRFLPGAKSFKIGPTKKFAFALFRTLIRIGTGKKITDPTTGLQGLDRKAFGFYAGQNHFDDQYPDANMIMQMLMLGFRIEEVPAVMHERKVGGSMHSGLRPVVYMLRMAYSIIAVWMRIRMYQVDVETANEFLGKTTSKQ